MKYLESIRMVHRDLAARNVLGDWAIAAHIVANHSYIVGQAFYRNQILHGS